MPSSYFSTSSMCGLLSYPANRLGERLHCLRFLGALITNFTDKSQLHTLVDARLSVTLGRSLQQAHFGIHDLNDDCLLIHLRSVANLLLALYY